MSSTPKSKRSQTRFEADHSLLAALHNDADTQIAAVKIVTEYGYDVQGFFEVVDHTVKETATTETVTE